MKSDREFLNGVYQKAEALQQPMNNAEAQSDKKPKFQFVKKYKQIAIAAVVMLIAIPMIYYNTMPTMKAPNGYENQTPRIARFATLCTPEFVAGESDLVIRAKVKRIEHSVYQKDNITTNVKLTIKDIYKGQYQEKEITVCVNGGYDKATKTFQEYEAVFKRAEDTLLFLTKENDKYILTESSQGKYTYLKTEGTDRVYQGTGGTTIRMSELQKYL